MKRKSESKRDNQTENKSARRNQIILGVVLSCLAALLPSALLYFPNIAEIPFAGMLPYFGTMIALGIISWVVFFLITRRKGFAAIVATLWLLVYLNIGRIVPVLQSAYPLIGLKVIFPVSLVIMIGISFLLSRLSEEFLYDATKVAALAFAVFFLSSAIPSIIAYVQTEEKKPIDKLTIDISPAKGADTPNIYWIILDEYAGIDELKKYYHYDNSDFYDALRDMGFTVSEHSMNWSTDTFKILQDILNLQFLDPADAQTRAERVADPDAQLWITLRCLGYKIYEVESVDKFGLIDRLKREERGNVPETADGETVANLLLKYSILYRYENEIVDVILPKHSTKTAREEILSVFEWAEKPSNIKGNRKTCTVIYAKCPHAPFLFDKDGNEVPEEHQTDFKDKHYYLDQLIYTSDHLKKICHTIIESDPGSIIILQSDHGQRGVANVTWLDTTNVLNAVYFHGESLEEITDKNAINTWIAILRKQFHLDIAEVEEIRLGNNYREEKRDPEQEDPNAGLLD